MRRWHGRLLIGLVGVLGLAGRASATAVLQLELEDLVPLAPLVVVGEVNRVEASWNEDQTRIYTRVWISPTEVLKGRRDLGTVVVKTIGGQVGDTVAHLPGAPRFEVGERVLVFLEPRRDQDGYLTVGFYQGKFSVFNDPKSGRDLLLGDPPRKGVTVLGAPRAAASRGLRGLDEVRALCAGGTR